MKPGRKGFLPARAEKLPDRCDEYNVGLEGVCTAIREHECHASTHVPSVLYASLRQPCLHLLVALNVDLPASKGKQITD